MRRSQFEALFIVAIFICPLAKGVSLEEENQLLQAKVSTLEHKVDEISKILQNVVQQNKGVNYEFHHGSRASQGGPFTFHVQTKKADEFWPTNKVISYEERLIDTYDAVNMTSGIFTAPFNGVYGFIFSGEIKCLGRVDLFAVKNDIQIPIFTYETFYEESSFFSSQTAHFYFRLNYRDQVYLLVGDEELVYLRDMPAQFFGFLIMEE